MVRKVYQRGLLMPTKKEVFKEVFCTIVIIFFNLEVHEIPMTTSKGVDEGGTFIDWTLN